MAYSFVSSPQDPEGIIQELKDADPDEMPELYNLLAVSMLASDPARSIAYTDTAIYLARLHMQNEEILKGLKTKGHAYFNIEMPDSALHILAEAEQFCIKNQDMLALSSVLQYTGKLCTENTYYPLSIRHYSRELEIETQSADSSGMMDAIYHMALAYDLWGKYDSALIYYNKAFKIADMISDSTHLANIQNNLGNIHLAWGNYQKALDLYLDALSIYESIYDSNGLSKTYNNIGIIYYDWGEIEKALQFYILSFEVDSLMSNVKGQAQTLNNIGITYDEMGQKEKALQVYNRSLDMAQQLGDYYQIAITTSNIGSFYLEAGDFDKAEIFYAQTLEEYKRSNSIVGVAETDILLGDLYMEKGGYKEAVDYYHSGLKKVSALNLTGVMIAAYEGLAESSMAMGDYKNAYIYAQKHHHLRDSVFSVETSNNLALLTNAYEIQKTEQEMEVQSARLSEQKSRIRKQQISLIALSGTIIIIAVFSFLLIRQYRLRMRAWNQLIQQHEEILENRQQLIIAKEKAEESDRLKSSFLVNLSHELRTPMNGIMGFTDLLQKGTVSPEQQQTYLSYIASASRQLLKVLNDIIDIASIETGQLELEIEPCNIYELCNNLIDILEKEKEEAGKKAIEIIFDEAGTEHQQLMIMTDKNRLSQILYNLLSNALIFTREGSIHLSYRIIDERIINISVKDTGIGIERQKFDIIFDRFRQVDESTTRPHGGSGLGLAISKELLNLLDGKIYLESELGKGSTFFVEIPFKEADSRL